MIIEPRTKCKGDLLNVIFLEYKNTGSDIYQSVTAIAELVVAVDSFVCIAGCMAMCVHNY